MADLKGKVALVDGAAQTLGTGIVAGLAEAGATIYLVDHAGDGATSAVADTLAAAAARVESLGGQSAVHLIEASNDQAVAELFVRIAGEQDRLDLLVNNVALFQPSTPAVAAFWETPVADWDDRAPLTLRDSYLRSAQAARMMVPAGSGLMINLCAGELSPTAGSLPQRALSAGIRAMTLDMASVLGRRGVSMLALDPEVILTESAVASQQINQQAQYVGRALAALTMDPDISDKNAGCFAISELASEYRFSAPEAAGAP